MNQHLFLEKYLYAVYCAHGLIRGDSDEEETICAAVEKKFLLL